MHVSSSYTILLPNVSELRRVKKARNEQVPATVSQKK